MPEATSPSDSTYYQHCGEAKIVLKLSKIYGRDIPGDLCSKGLLNRVVQDHCLKVFRSISFPLELSHLAEGLSLMSPVQKVPGQQVLP